jgi:hypothetical protein
VQAERARVFWSGFGTTQYPEKLRTSEATRITEGLRAHQSRSRTRFSFVHMILAWPHVGYHARPSDVFVRPCFCVRLSGVTCAIWAHKNVKRANTTCTHPRARPETPCAECTPGTSESGDAVEQGRGDRRGVPCWPGILSSNQIVFDRRSPRTPHVTVVTCFNPGGKSTPPGLALPGPKKCCGIRILCSSDRVGWRSAAGDGWIGGYSESSGCGLLRGSSRGGR